MKEYWLVPVLLGLANSVWAGPNLVIQDATIDFMAKTVSVTVMNIGNRKAAKHLTSIEINHVGIAGIRKPQAQFSAQISSIHAGDSWSSGAIPFHSFSVRPGMNLSSLETANLVVRADAKNWVAENNELDNLYDATQ